MLTDDEIGYRIVCDMKGCANYTPLPTKDDLRRLFKEDGWVTINYMLDGRPRHNTGPLHVCRPCQLRDNYPEDWPYGEEADDPDEESEPCEENPE